MKNVISHMFSFIKHLFLRLRLVITLNIGRSMDNEEGKENPDNEDSGRKEGY